MDSWGLRAPPRPLGWRFFSFPFQECSAPSLAPLSGCWAGPVLSIRRAPEAQLRPSCLAPQPPRGLGSGACESAPASPGGGALRGAVTRDSLHSERWGEEKTSWGEQAGLGLVLPARFCPE